MATPRQPAQRRTNGSPPRQPAGEAPKPARARRPRRATPLTVDFSVRLSAVVSAEPAGGFSAEVPALPGCFTQAETLEELRENLQEAAEGWLLAQQDLVRSESEAASRTGRARR